MEICYILISIAVVIAILLWFIHVFQPNSKQIKTNGGNEMTDEQLKVLEDIRLSLVNLVEVAKGAEQPTRAILNTQIFLIIQKVKYLEGKTE